MVRALTLAGFKLSGLSAKVVGSFDSSVTHIVSDLPEKLLLEVIGLSSVDSIPPSVWVVSWTWVTKSMNVLSNCFIR
jgi:hypothetical protein